ncbi:MAG: hypothetical protein GYB67_08915 [Chloroflexi bacterium]|nr:hypothetical protein [Chloroflexota bacterium]
MSLRPFTDEAEALTYIFQSFRRVRQHDRGPDERARSTAPTIDLLRRQNLLGTAREYAVITGSKGKGSTAAIMAKLLEKIGHTVGLITSPHLVSYRERIRINGRAIPSADLIRILNALRPDIDAITARFTGDQYFSPQGIFLAVALRWFTERGVNAAVLEVGRGGRYDDIAVVPNKLALFTPILLEHVQQLGPTLERIAWHKAGIIKRQGWAYSVPQAPEVFRVIQAEADAQDAEFAWIAPIDMADYLGETPDGARLRLGRYGEVTLGLRGRHQVENATLAVQGAGNMHARLPGITHGSPAYVAAIRAGLSAVRWPGRIHKLQSDPAVFVDGATNPVAARSLLESLAADLSAPPITIVATPVDRDYAGVYRVLGAASRRLILTESDINPGVRFPDKNTAQTAAREFNADVRYAPSLPAALNEAFAAAAPTDTILLAVAQPLVGEAVQRWGCDLEVI